MAIFMLEGDGSVSSHEPDSSLIELAKKLPYAHSRYFIQTSNSILVQTKKLILSRSRTKGIWNAAHLMEAAFLGQQAPRNPIEIKPFNDERFVVVDGNSTSTIAIIAGWPDIPAVRTC